jgi:hypothetical protein
MIRRFLGDFLIFKAFWEILIFHWLFSVWPLTLETNLLGTLDGSKIIFITTHTDLMEIIQLKRCGMNNDVIFSKYVKNLIDESLQKCKVNYDYFKKFSCLLSKVMWGVILWVFPHELTEVSWKSLKLGNLVYLLIS